MDDKISVEEIEKLNKKVMGFNFKYIFISTVKDIILIVLIFLLLKTFEIYTFTDGVKNFNYLNIGCILGISFATSSIINIGSSYLM